MRTLLALVATVAFAAPARAWELHHEVDLPVGMAQACDVSGDTIVVGIQRANEVRVFVRDAGGWSEQAMLVPFGRIDAERRVGGSVAIDGDVVAFGDASGEANVFTRTGETWSFTSSVAGGPLESWVWAVRVDVRGDLLMVSAPDHPVDGSPEVGEAS